VGDFARCQNRELRHTKQTLHNKLNRVPGQLCQLCNNVLHQHPEPGLAEHPLNLVPFCYCETALLYQLGKSIAREQLVILESRFHDLAYLNKGLLAFTMAGGRYDD
jgi:hypothetical protein